MKFFVIIFIALIITGCFGPSDSEQLYDKAVKMELEQGIESALPVYKEVVEKYKKSDEAKISLKKIEVYIREKLERDGNLRRAKEMRKKADAILHNSSANAAEALPLLHKSHEIFISLTNSSPKNTLYQTELARSYLWLGNLQLKLGITDQALVSFQAYVAANKKLTGLAPQNPKYQDALSYSYYNLSKVQLHLGEIEQGLASYQAGLAVSKNLVKLDPKNPESLRGLLTSHEKLGNLQLRMGEIEQALTSYQASVALGESLIELEPEDILNKMSLLAIQSSIIKVYAKKGDYISASNEMIRYIEFDGVGIIDNKIPRDVGLLEGKWVSYLKWSWYRLYTDKVNEIPAVLTKVISYLPSKDESAVILHTNLAHAYLLSGDYKAAKAVYEKHKGFEFKDGNTWNKAILDDFKALAKEGITHPDFTRIAKEVFGLGFPAVSNK